MSKLPKENQFIDLSDYGRKSARWIVNALKNTSVTPIDLTTSFIISGLLAIVAILNGYYVCAAFLLILKSILDAADGEMSRVKQTPSYVGRYYDSIADILLNFLFLLSLWHINDSSFLLMLIAFIGIQLQGTLYNYYYVILRNSVKGDTTSRIFEDCPPEAMEGERQSTVNLFFHIYNTLYIIFDKCIYYLDRNARYSPPFPSWYMTLLSTYGLGFQLLIMAVLLALGWQAYIIPFFIVYTSLIILYIGIRRWVL